MMKMKLIVKVKTIVKKMKIKESLSMILKMGRRSKITVKAINSKKMFLTLTS